MRRSALWSAFVLLVAAALYGGCTQNFDQFTSGAGGANASGGSASNSSTGAGNNGGNGGGMPCDHVADCPQPKACEDLACLNHLCVTSTSSNTTPCVFGGAQRRLRWQREVRRVQRRRRLPHAAHVPDEHVHQSQVRHDQRDDRHELHARCRSTAKTARMCRLQHRRHERARRLPDAAGLPDGRVRQHDVRARKRRPRHAVRDRLLRRQRRVQAMRHHGQRVHVHEHPVQDVQVHVQRLHRERRRDDGHLHDGRQRLRRERQLRRVQRGGRLPRWQHQRDVHEPHVRLQRPRPARACISPAAVGSPTVAATRSTATTR